MSRITTPDTVAGAHVAVAQVDATGKLSLVLDGKVIGESPGNGPLAVLPTDGLDVGDDTGGLVLAYKAATKFAGVITSVTIEIRRAKL